MKTGCEKVTLSEHSPMVAHQSTLPIWHNLLNTVDMSLYPVANGTKEISGMIKNYSVTMRPMSHYFIIIKNNW